MRDVTEFPEIQDLVTTLSARDRRAVQDDYRLGLRYYLNRLDRLMFSGGRVLDAGCGAGEWSIALAQRFRQVESIGLNRRHLWVFKQVADRIGIQNVRVRESSLEQLPYHDESFEAVFCDRAMMSCDLDRALAEFFRVTRPGGRIYVCVNGDGWSHYLITERGRTEAEARERGLKTLYRTYWRRAIEQGLGLSLKKKHQILSGLMTEPLSRVLFGTLGGVRRLGWKKPSRTIARFLLLHSQGGTELWDGVRGCGEDFTRTLLDDVWELLAVQREPSDEGPRTFLPREFAGRVEAAGFADFQWSTEAGLACDWLEPVPEARYATAFAGVLAVWEGLFVKPDRPALVSSPEFHRQEGIRARQTSVYQATTEAPILSNSSQWTYPKGLFEHARQLGRELGGTAYLRRLAHTITEGARDDAEAARRLITFVQSAIFRDPVSQPLTDSGEMPDALTTLLCGRGRCGHVSHLLVELFQQSGWEARITRLPKHVIAEVKIAGRWGAADADAFKHGVIPVNRHGQLLTFDEIHENPYQLDRFPPTGWFLQPGSRHTCDAMGRKVLGYVDALHPDVRGYVSGYYVPEARGYPPSLPVIVRFEAKGGRYYLEWTPSRCREDRLLGYRVSLRTSTRGWSYDDVVNREEFPHRGGADLLSTTTVKSSHEGELPGKVARLFACVTAFSSRIEKEPETYFWPSEEAVLEADEMD